MGSREIWPPLEDVRTWAAAKMHSGQTAPVVNGKLEHLVALIDEILAARAPEPESDEMRRQQQP
jgi:hypothetical protein